MIIQNGKINNITLKSLIEHNYRAKKIGNNKSILERAQ